MELNIDWKSLAGAVAPLAPQLGTVLGAGFGPLGSIIGGLAGNAIAATFNVEATPEAVGRAIATDPNAAAKLEALEAERGQAILAEAQVKIEELKQETAQFQIAADSTEQARQFQQGLVSANSGFAWGPVVISAIVTLSFSIVLITWMFFPPVASPEALAILNVLVGTLAAAFGQVINYWLGSSAGSKSKDLSLRAALVGSQANAKQAIAAPAPVKAKK